MSKQIRWTGKERESIFREVHRLQGLVRPKSTQVRLIEEAQWAVPEDRRKSKIWPSEAFAFLQKYKVWSAAQRLAGSMDIDAPAANSARTKRKYTRQIKTSASVFSVSQLAQIISTARELLNHRTEFEKLVRAMATN